MSDLAATQRALAEVCLAAEVSPAALAVLGGDPARWQVYRDLVRSRHWALALEALPRTFAVAGRDRFAAWFTRFLAEDPPRTHFVRDVAPALARSVIAAEGPALAHPSPWLPDALALDLAAHHVGLTDARPDPSTLTDFAMHLPAALAPSHRRLRLAWSPDHDGWIERPQARLLYRHPTAHTVETLALTPMAADVLDALDDGVTPAAEAVRGVLARHDVAAGAAFVESLAGLLADLLERGVLLGSRRT